MNDAECKQILTEYMNSVPRSLTEPRIREAIYHALGRLARYEKETPEQHKAMAAFLENLIDNLVESGNGFEIDDAWIDDTINDAIQCRDNPVEYLKRDAVLPAQRSPALSACGVCDDPECPSRRPDLWED